MLCVFEKIIIKVRMGEVERDIIEVSSISFKSFLLLENYAIIIVCNFEKIHLKCSSKYFRKDCKSINFELSELN